METDESIDQNRLAQREAMLLEQLGELKQALIALDDLPQRSQYAQLSQTFAVQLAQLSDRHRQNKAQRKAQREAINSGQSGTERDAQLAQLAERSRRDGRERRSLKQQRDRALAPLSQAIAQANSEMTQLKRRYKTLSAQLRIELRRAYCLSYLARSAPSAALNQDAPADLSLVMLYEDDWLIAIEKPAGLLSVPGRSRQTQDSVLSRLCCQRGQTLEDAAEEPEGEANQGDRLLYPVHRLDQATSGILLLAKGRKSQRQLQAQFWQQQVAKTYEALLDGLLTLDEGLIDLPLAADPDHRPRQRVDHAGGRPSQTHFRVLARQGEQSRVCFEPQTGRTHQLRVHAAAGLGLAIVGDRLYGMPSSPAAEHRLCLHACSLRLRHPVTGREIKLRSPAPF